MFAKLFLSLCLLPVTGLAAETGVSRTPETRSATHAEAALYVWAHHLGDIGTAVAIARSQGFVPTSRPIFLRYVPEAGGAAWVVYIRPCW
jgi:hypothetical protein